MSHLRKDTPLRLLAVLGIAGPICYTIVVATLGFLQADYSHLAQTMSELGEAGAPNAMLMNVAGFMLLGLSMIAFAFGLHRGVGEGSGLSIGPALIAVSGASLVLVGFFPCDPGCVDRSFSGRMHSVAATVPGILMSIAPFAVALKFGSDRRWKSLRLYTLVTGVATSVLGLMLLFARIEGLMGLLQRVAMAVPLLWMEITSIRLLQLASNKP